MNILKVVPMILTAIVLSVVLVGGLSLMTGVAYDMWWAMAVGAITGLPISMLAVILFYNGENNGVITANE